MLIVLRLLFDSSLYMTDWTSEIHASLYVDGDNNDLHASQHEQTGRAPVNGEPHRNVDAPWTVFYNVYIPTNAENGTQNAIRIVEEQIQQVRDSPAASANATTIPIKFVTIGLANILTPEKLTQMCPFPLDCQLAAHFNDGAESRTLVLSETTANTSIRHCDRHTWSRTCTTRDPIRANVGMNTGDEP